MLLHADRIVSALTELADLSFLISTETTNILRGIHNVFGASKNGLQNDISHVNLSMAGRVWAAVADALLWLLENGLG